MIGIASYLLVYVCVPYVVFTATVRATHSRTLGFVGAVLAVGLGISFLEGVFRAFRRYRDAREERRSSGEV